MCTTVYADDNSIRDNIHKQRIMIDLDGVLNNYENYDSQKIPDMRIGADIFLKTLYEENKYELYLFTARNNLQAVKWLEKNNIDRYFVNVTNVKIPASIYIDDRGIFFNGDYEKLLKDIDSFKPYWK